MFSISRTSSASSSFRAESEKSNVMECVNFLSKMKLKIFPDIKQQLDNLEKKFESSFKYFISKENEAKKMLNENIDLLEKFSQDSFIKLKKDINTESILIDDNIFMEIYNKLKEIDNYKNGYLNDILSKYKGLNLLIIPFIKEVEKITDNIKNIFENSLKKEIYGKLKNDIDEKAIIKIKKEAVEDLMFKNVIVERKSLKKTFVKAKTNMKTKNVANLENIKGNTCNKQYGEEINPFAFSNSKKTNLIQKYVLII